MSYFVTGATGFLGRHLLERLLAGREGKVYVLVRESSTGRLDELIDRWASAAGASATKRIVPVIGDLRRPLLGVEEEQVSELRGQIGHFIHLAAVYDMTAPAERNTAANVGGTTHAVELARSLEARCLHHVSSIAVAGAFHGTFTEEMFDVGQKLPSPYHRTKFEAERIVREQPFVPWRVYRPAVVVGDSRTGEMDKVDGPYYFFKAIQRARQLLPEWLPLVGVDLGRTNIVPVDWVAGAMDHLVHQPDLDGRAFHLTDSRGQRVDELINELAAAAHAPRLAVSLDRRLTRALPTWPLSLALQLPPWRQLRGLALREFGIPEEVLAHMELVPRFDSTATQLALAGSGLEEPPQLRAYAARLWDYWEREMDPDLSRDRTLQEAVEGRRVLITGASSGIGRATALKVAAAGGIPLLVARNVERLEEVRAEIVAAGGAAYVYAADMSEMDSVDDLVERVLADHRHVEMVVNNAGRSIRRSIALSYDRFHDFERTMQLNYFGAIRLIIGLLPDMRERGVGAHREHLLDRRADQPAAVLRLRRLEGRPGRLHAGGGLGDDRGRRDLHHDPHAARAHPDDRADEDVRRLPRDHPRAGGGHDLRGAAHPPQAHGHPPGDRGGGPLRPLPQGGGPHPAPRLPRVPRLRRLARPAGPRGACLLRADRDGDAHARGALVASAPAMIRS